MHRPQPGLRQAGFLAGTCGPCMHDHAQSAADEHGTMPSQLPAPTLGQHEVDQLAAVRRNQAGALGGGGSAAMQGWRLGRARGTVGGYSHVAAASRRRRSGRRHLHCSARTTATPDLNCCCLSTPLRTGQPRQRGGKRRPGRALRQQQCDGQRPAAARAEVRQPWTQQRGQPRGQRAPQRGTGPQSPWVGCRVAGPTAS